MLNPLKKGRNAAAPNAKKSILKRYFILAGAYLKSIAIHVRFMCEKQNLIIIVYTIKKGLKK